MFSAVKEVMANVLCFCANIFLSVLLSKERRYFVRSLCGFHKSSWDFLPDCCKHCNSLVYYEESDRV
jgi:hypothetical protein